MRPRLSLSPRTLLTGAALGGLIAVLLPIWITQHVVARIRVRRRPTRSTEIPRVDFTSTDLHTILQHRTPVIIRGLTESLDLDLIPDLDGLRSLATVGHSQFRVKTHRDHSPYFLYRGDYGAEIDHTADMELDDFVRFMFDAEQQPGTCTYRLFTVAELDGRVGDIVDDIATRLAERTEARPDRNASGLWIGSRGVVTPLHHDAWTGLLFQFHGSKRIRMFAPRDRPNLYFSSPFSPRAVWSRLPGRSADTDLAEFPRFAHAEPYDAQLDAGEVLFIPPYWSHEIEALEANISMPFRFTTTAREYLDPGFLMPAIELFDTKFVRPRTLQK